MHQTKEEKEGARVLEKVASKAQYYVLLAEIRSQIKKV